MYLKGLVHDATYKGNLEIIGYLSSLGMDINRIEVEYSLIGLAVVFNRIEKCNQIWGRIRCKYLYSKSIIYSNFKRKS